MTPAEPAYFGPADRARFGYLDWPDGPVRGGAVVCPPLGYEEVCAHTALRHLAESLAAGGIVTLRIDYDGTGNSVGDAHDPDRVAAWTESVVDAVEQLRSWGLPHVTLVGVRFGATLAVTASERVRSAIDACVLWDPVVSGRRHVRAMKLFSAAGGFEPGPDGGVCIAGVEFDGPTLDAMAKTGIDGGALDMPCLLVVRAEAESEGAQLAEEHPAAPLTVRTLPGTTDLLDTDAELAVVPGGILHEIACWVTGRATTALEPQPARPTPRNEAREVRGDAVLHHRAIRIGPARLLAIETVRSDAAPTGAVVAVNNGVARSIGPGRAWVEFGDRLACEGWRVVRVDLSGLGDSPRRPGRAENDSYSPSAADDLADVAGYLRAEGVDRLGLLGLCSGAFVGFDAVVAGAGLDVLLCINGRYDKPFHDRRPDRAKRAAGQTNRMLAVPLNKTPLLPFFEKVPTWIWRLLDRLHLVASPTVAFEKALARGVRVFMVFGTGEWGLGALRQRGGRRFNEITQNPLTTLVEVPGLDHSMFDITRRETVKAHVHGYLTDLGTGGRAPALERD